MLICSCIPLVCLNPSSVNLDRAVSLCGSLYTSPKLLRYLPSTYHRLMVCSPTLFAFRLGHSLCVYSQNLSIQNTQGIHPLLHLLSPLVVCLSAFARTRLTYAIIVDTSTAIVWLLVVLLLTPHIAPMHSVTALVVSEVCKERYRVWQTRCRFRWSNI